MKVLPGRIPNRTVSIFVALVAVGPPAAALGQTRLAVDVAVTATGDATAAWLEVLRARLDGDAFAEAAAVRHPLTSSERAWADLIASRLADWERETTGLSQLLPATPPSEARILLGNRGATDAFVHGPRRIGFDLAALVEAYGEAGDAVNRERIDRLFRHEYVHLMQKAWWADHPWPQDTPLRRAIADIWAEGLGTWYSLSDRWRSTGDGPGNAAEEALRRLEPRFIARLAGLACTSARNEKALTRDLSMGRFDAKWGALVAALWLEAEAKRDPTAVETFARQGPDAVRDLAVRSLDETLRSVLAEAFDLEDRCAVSAGPAG